jgi:hypothetical protein
MDDIFFVLSNQRENRNQRQFGSTDRHERKRNLLKKMLVFAKPTSAERIRAILLCVEIPGVYEIPGFWADTRVQERVVIGWAGVIGNGFLSTRTALLWLTVRCAVVGGLVASHKSCSLRLATS